MIARRRCLDHVTNASGDGVLRSLGEEDGTDKRRLVFSHNPVPVSEQCNAGSRGRVIRKELKEGAFFILSPFLGSGSKLERSPASSTEENQVLGIQLTVRFALADFLIFFTLS